MPQPRLALLLALLPLACGHAAPPTAEPPEPAPADAPVDESPDAAPADVAPEAEAPPVAVAAAGAQRVTFDDDADPEPTTLVQSAPKRPPMPRFRLFGTREGDGPN